MLIVLTLQNKKYFKKKMEEEDAIVARSFRFVPDYSHVFQSKIEVNVDDSDQCNMLCDLLKLGISDELEKNIRLNILFQHQEWAPRYLTIKSLMRRQPVVFVGWNMNMRIDMDMLNLVTTTLGNTSALDYFKTSFVDKILNNPNNPTALQSVIDCNLVSIMSIETMRSLCKKIEKNSYLPKLTIMRFIAYFSQKMRESYMSLFSFLGDSFPFEIADVITDLMYDNSSPSPSASYITAIGTTHLGIIHGNIINGNISIGGGNTNVFQPIHQIHPTN